MPFPHLYRCRLCRRRNHHYADNIERYIQEHSGDWILIEQEKGILVESFYQTRWKLDDATEKYSRLFGPTFFTKQIPKTLKRTEAIKR